MKKLRVFQAFKIKRIVPGNLPRNLGTVLLFLLLFPYMITFLFGNLQAQQGERMKDTGRPFATARFLWSIPQRWEQKIFR